MSASRKRAARASQAGTQQPARAGATGTTKSSRTAEHASAQPAPRAIGVAIVTVSDTRRSADDTSGALAERLLRRAGCAVVARVWTRDDVAGIRAALKQALKRNNVDAVVLTGGTGVAPRDVTPEAVEPLLERTLPGFGERFRALSWAEVGSAAWLSRAGAGVARGRLVVYLPGSAGAVRQALVSLVIPELVHVVRLLGRFQP